MQEKKKEIFDLSVKDITTIAILTTILFVQEEALTFLPNIQLTVLLIVLYSECLGWWRTSLIVLIHVILDNVVMGSLNYIYTPFMLLGWELIPLLLRTVFCRVQKPLPLAFLGILFSFLYCWLLLIPTFLVTEASFWPYFLTDLPFELILAASSFLSILWLYSPLKKVLDILYHTNVSTSVQK
jgi:energy-coupling factor transport system substrate-specific component